MPETKAINQMTSRELQIALRELRDHAGSKHYQRLKMADQLLKHRAWVEALDGGGGNESKALDRIEAEYFGDITGMVSLPELLDMLHHVPRIQDWQRHKYNFQKMWVEHREKTHPKQSVQKREFSVRRNDLTPPLSFPELDNGTAKREYSKAFDLAERYRLKVEKVEQEKDRIIAEKDAKIATLMGENTALKAENAAFRRREETIENVFRKRQTA